MISDGVVKLTRNGVFLTGDVDEQLNRLKDSWPENPSEDDLDGFGAWFLAEAINDGLIQVIRSILSGGEMNVPFIRAESAIASEYA